MCKKIFFFAYLFFIAVIALVVFGISNNVTPPKYSVVATLRHTEAAASAHRGSCLG